MKEHKRCHICDFSFERNNYYYGKLMTVRDFFAEQSYFNEKRWLMNRMISGWGIVCGLEVELKDSNTVIVKPGLAIDCCGREILVCEDQEVILDPQETECCEGEHEKDERRKSENLVICLEYHECKTEPIHLPPVACDQKEKYEFNRIRDSFKIRVRRISDVDLDGHCERICPLEHKTEKLHEYLCHELKECKQCPKHPCLLLAEIIVSSMHSREHPEPPYKKEPPTPPYQSPEQKSYPVQTSDQKTVEQHDPEKKTAEQYPQEQKPPYVPPTEPPKVQIDECSRRRFVYSNPLLYDLIHCYHGDLPHVKQINWEHEKEIKWGDFEVGMYSNGVRVWFDRNMNLTTIHKNTFLVMVRLVDPDTGNYRFEQIPGDISYEDEAITGHSISIFKFTTEWLMDTYFGYSEIKDKGGKFMVLLRSDFILDLPENGKPAKALDGNFLGAQLPSGNGTQGGDFVSWFYVEARPDSPKKDQKKSRD